MLGTYGGVRCHKLCTGFKPVVVAFWFVWKYLWHLNFGSNLIVGTGLVKTCGPCCGSWGHRLLHGRTMRQTDKITGDSNLLNEKDVALIWSTNHFLIQRLVTNLWMSLLQLFGTSKNLFSGSELLYVHGIKKCVLHNYIFVNLSLVTDLVPDDKLFFVRPLFNLRPNKNAVLFERRTATVCVMRRL